MNDFKRFDRAVQLHKGNNYTLCDLLYLMKCIVSDIVSEYGSVDTLPIGDDEQFGGLMANQCYILGELIDIVNERQIHSEQRLEDIRQELAELTSRISKYEHLYREIHTLTEKKQTMELQLTELMNKKAEYDKLVLSVESVERGIEKADDFDLETTQKKLVSLREELDKKTKNNAALVTKISEYETALHQAEHTERDSDNRLAELEQKLSTLREHVKELDASVIDKQTEEAALQKTVDSLSSTVESLNGGIAGYELKIQECEVILRSEKVHLSEEHRAKISEIEGMTQRIHTLKKELQSAEEMKEQLTNSVTALETDISALDDAVTALNASADSYRDKMASFSVIFSSTKDALSDEYMIILSDIDSAGTEIGKLQANISRKTELQNSLAARVTALTENAAALQAMVDSLTTSEEALADKISVQAQTIDKTESHLSETVSQLLTETVNDADNIIKMRRQFHELNTRKKQQKIAADRLSQYLTAAKKLIASIDGDTAQYDAALKDMSAVLAAHTDKMSEEHSSQMAAANIKAAQVQKLQSDIEQLKKMTEDNAALCEKMQKTKTELTAAAIHIQQVVNELNGDMAGLAALFSELETARDPAMQAARSRLESDYDRLNDEYNRFYYNTLKPQMDDNARLQEKINTKDTEYQSAHDKNAQLNKELSQLESRLQRLNNDNTALADSIDKQKQSVLAAEQTYHGLYDENQALNDNIIRIQKLNTELKDNIIPGAEKIFSELKSIRASLETSILEKTAAFCSLIGEQYAELMQDMSSIDGKVKTAFDRLTEIRRQYESKTIQISGYSQDIEELQRKIRELEEQNEKEQSSGVKQQLIDRIQELKQIIESRSKAINKLEQDIDALNADTDKLKEQENELTAQKQTLEEKKGQLIRYNADIQAMLGDDFQKKLHRVEDNIRKLSPLNDSLLRMMQFIIHITGDDNIINNSVKSQIEKYDRALHDLNDILPEIQSRIVDAASNLSELIKMEEVG